ncbi:MAG: F0F1 ATP synthase subunit B [Thermodesulfovibrionia bacterium]|nr:F0F1 ATP synthase subunit B [Thermodesulfovibrionia bacterium]
MPQFDLHFLTPLTFWSIISFTILMVILYKYALPAITGILDARQEKIKGDIDQAEKLREDAEKKLAEYQEKLQFAFQKSEEVVNDAVKKSEEIHKKKLGQTLAEKEKILSDARKTIDIERKKALAEVRNQVVDLTVYASARLIQQSINHDTAERLVDDVISEVEKLS